MESTCYGPEAGQKFICLQVGVLRVLVNALKAYLEDLEENEETGTVDMHKNVHAPLMMHRMSQYHNVSIYWCCVQACIDDPVGDVWYIQAFCG